jgi:hypothetical protein
VPWTASAGSAINARTDVERSGIGRRSAKAQPLLNAALALCPLMPTVVVGLQVAPEARRSYRGSKLHDRAGFAHTAVLGMLMTMH